MNNIFIFLPNTLKRHKPGYIKGCHKQFEDCEAFYITDDVVSNNYKHCTGYIGRSIKSSKYKTEHCVFINSLNNKITINNNDQKSRSLVVIIYNYEGFKNSDIICREGDSYGKHFKYLAEELRKSNLNGGTNGRKSIAGSVAAILMYLINFVLKVVRLAKPLLQYSATFLHFEESVVNLQWLLEENVKKKKLTPKTGNLVVAKVIDLLIGIILLHWCLKYEKDILNFIQLTIEDIIMSLKSLLLYLMGSPIGLKLNHAFNNILGKFFFYHISLWRVFLQGMEPLLRLYFGFLVLPGALGFSFQIAMFSDIVSIATFHIYCIYVYAARLFSLQIRGISSLWRLFIGRKYNPLRQRVDSCKYSPDQLFIGTLGFSVLLFLLPTTTMYYTVFTTFRLLILLANGLLSRLRFLLNMLPLYVIMLWIFNSSSVAGTVYLNWKNEDSEEVTIEAKLNSLPLNTSLKKFVPDPVKPVEGNSVASVLHRVVTGILL